MKKTLCRMVAFLALGSMSQVSMSAILKEPQGVVTFVPTQQVIENIEIVSPPELNREYQFFYDTDPALKKAYQTFLKTGKAPNIETQGFEQFAYDVGAQPIVATRPLELTVITLEPGENVTNVSSGDPTRWSYSMAHSRKENQRQAHILVKPSQPDISTDLVITTDKRLYILKLVATDKKYVREVRFWYPQDMQHAWGEANTQLLSQHAHQQDVIVSNTDVRLDQLNFDYTVSPQGSRRGFSWKPTRVFDDGTHTFIQFPTSVKSQDLPALFIQNGATQELVNYRSKPPYFVVDKIFRQAVLVSNVGKQKQLILLTNRQLG